MFNAKNAVATTDRVFTTEDAATKAQPSFPPKSNELGAVYADPAKLEAALELAKAGKPIGWSVDDTGRARCRNVAIVLLGLTSPAPGKAKNVVVVEKVVEPDVAKMSADELARRIKELTAAAKALK